MDEDVLNIKSEHKQRGVVIVIKFQAIPKATADAACESLDKEIARKREESALEAGKWSSVILEWTIQTREVVCAYMAVCANLKSYSQSSETNIISLRILHLSIVSVATQRAASNGQVQ
jgi:hypothetical protein